ncbi:hypothetical protein [Paenarthrobacter nitroguajacolicus]|uniref:hypothetical protein n=1 Tax=Paenarthrobacter nitroguajacolicus TaxID=211146 RepID=UPI001C4AC021|nr:hypothetical protein [Paenarthrobacter nitroguajacolicus]NWL34416.1 hypothetical protein [Paenarthrobacter nitroguajacolicus]
MALAANGIRLWGAALAFATAVTLAGCGTGSKNPDGDKTIVEKVNGQTMRLDLAGGSAKGLAVWFHGQGGTADTRMNEAWLNELRVNGWAVASADFHGNAWGNADAVADVAALTKWAAEKVGKDATLYVAGSMGGLTSLNSMAQGGHAPKCWYGTMPVVDQLTVSNVPDADTQIQTAYGSTTVPQASIPAHNFNTLPSAKYRVLASPEDTWVPAKQNADVLAAGLQAAGKEVTTLAVSGQHGDPSHFNGSDLARFAADCA